MIPKIIHRMWLDKNIDNNTIVPKKYNKYIESFNKYNPEFKVEFWNRDKINKLFDEYPIIKKYQDVWENLPHHIQKCDMARYFIMYLFGGIYIDLDFICYKNLSPLLNRELLLVMEPPEHSEIFEKGKKLYNGFIGSIPGHKFWLEWLDFICESVKGSDDVMQTTGPSNFGRFWENSNYQHIPLVDTCDIIPLYYCYETPHCLSRDCAKRLDQNDLKSTDYYKKLGNYADTTWISGSQWGKEKLTEKDLMEKMTNTNNNNNNMKIWTGLLIALTLLAIIFVIYYLFFKKCNK